VGVGVFEMVRQVRALDCVAVCGCRCGCLCV